MRFSVDQREHERRLGVLALGVALLIALVIVAASRFFGDDQPSAPVVPTSAPISTLRIATPPAATPTPGLVPPGELASDGRSVVCLDPGHGGADQGNVRVENGRIVLQEKD
ncbi:MAG: hypothetical protein M3411_00930, partial [Chloroflexota bacterium]|nr:hypothetical protein [Chloroflexota bacterium]